jgi:hypothetical protein
MTLGVSASLLHPTSWGRGVICYLLSCGNFLNLRLTGIRLIPLICILGLTQHNCFTGYLFLLDEDVCYDLVFEVFIEADDELLFAEEQFLF